MTTEQPRVTSRKRHQELARTGAREGLQAGALALGLALPIALAIVGPANLLAWWLQLAVGAGTVLALGVVLGRQLGPAAGGPWGRLVGTSFAFATLALASMLGAALSLLGEGARSFADDPASAIESYVGRPLFWLCAVGWIPALLLGLRWTRRVRRSEP